VLTFFFSSRRRHTRSKRDWSSDVCSSDLNGMMGLALLKNYNPFGAPPSLTLIDIMKKFDKSFGLSGKSYGKVTGDRTVDDIQKQIGRASCRERVEKAGGGGALKERRSDIG